MEAERHKEEVLCSQQEMRRVRESFQRHEDGGDVLQLLAGGSDDVEVQRRTIGGGNGKTRMSQ